MSVHCLITAFEIPLVPGALNGFSLMTALLICSSMISSYLNALFGYEGSLLAMVCYSFGAGKVSNSILAFSSFMLAVHVVLSRSLVVNIGTLVQPPSDASADAYLCAVQTVFSSICSRKSQWSFLIF